MNNEGRMPLLSHLNEFRRRIFVAAILIVLGSIVGWIYYNQIIAALAKPVCDLALAQASGSTHCGSLYINGVLRCINVLLFTLSGSKYGLKYSFKPYTTE